MSSTQAAPSAVKMFDYRVQLAAIRAEVLQAVADVLDSGQLILGPRVEQFERNFARWIGAGVQGVGVANGTDALAIALRALNVGPGDEVLTVANTAIPTVSAIRMVGATPVFCDVEADTLLIDLCDAERKITPRTQAIIPVHLFGNAVDMPAVLDLAQRHNLRVVEDCAQSTGTQIDGRHTGTFGDVGCFSFYPTKNLGAYGDGGLCIARDAELAAAMRRIRMYGCGQTYYAEQEGVNSRLDELHAAILDVKLRHLDDWIARRRALAAIYDQALEGVVERPRVRLGVSASYHLYVIAVEQRAALIECLKHNGIATGIHYPHPIHLMRGYEFLGYRAGSLAVTEHSAERIVSLPCYPELSDEAAERVAAVICDARQAG